MGLEILPLRNLIGDVLHLEGKGILILYKGYIEANLTIPDILQYSENVLVISDHNYGERDLCK